MIRPASVQANRFESIGRNVSMTLLHRRHKFTVQGWVVSVGFVSSGGGLIQAAVGSGGG